MRKSEFGGRNGASGALSAPWRLWQCLWVAGAALTVSGGALNASEIGPVAVMKQGNYWCETPGNALGRAGIHQPDQDFSIKHASIYASGGQTGTYLLTGDVIRFTSGPRKGDSFRRVSENFLRKRGPDGKDTDIRCIRSVLNNAEANEPAPAKP